MIKIKQIKSIVEDTGVKFEDHILMYLDKNTPLEYTKCPSCTGPVYYGAASCPDADSGCYVAHYGYGCFDCKKSYHLDIEYEPQVGPIKPFTISEKIGVAFINPKGIKNLTVMKKESE